MTKIPTVEASPTFTPDRNQLLAALSPEEQARLFPHLQLVELPLGKTLHESGDAQRFVYFPADAIVSLLHVMEDGASAEVAVVGHEGITGIALFLGGGTTPSRAVVQSPATRIDCSASTSRTSSTATAACRSSCCDSRRRS